MVQRSQKVFNLETKRVEILVKWQKIGGENGILKKWRFWYF